MQRIVIVGATGSGKTTLARDLANRFGHPHVELDALFWEENWQNVPLDIFRERVDRALDRETWVADGNYSKVRDLVWDRADTLIWLDYPLIVIFPRLFMRTLTRLISREKLWDKNQEILWNHLGRNSLFLWLLKSHPRHRREYPALLQDSAYGHLHAVRLRSPRATRQWLATLDSPSPVIQEA